MLEPEPEPAQREAAALSAVMLEPANGTTGASSPAAVSASPSGPVVGNWPAVELVLQQDLLEVLL